MKITKNIFTPITVGGGIRSIDDIKEVLIYACYKPLLNNTSLVNYLSKKLNQLNFKIKSSH